MFPRSYSRILDFYSLACCQWELGGCEVHAISQKEMWTIQINNTTESQIDNIAVNVGRAETDVEAGKGHLDKAKTLRASARKKKIIFGIVIAIILLIVLLVVLVRAV